MTRTGEVVDPTLRVYAKRARQWLLAFGLLAVYLATLSLVFEPDPDTGQKPLPGDYLWVVIPGSIVLIYLLWRAMKARIETNQRGVDVIRTVGHEYFPWKDIRDFELGPTPTRQGYAVRMRQKNETLVTVRNEINVRPLRDRDEARRLAKIRAEAFLAELEADRLARIGPPPTSNGSAGAPDAPSG